MRRTVRHARFKRAAVVLLLAAAGGHAQSANAVITSDTGQDLSQIIGASSFYNAGFTGTDAIIANVEAGYVWNAAGTPLQNVSTYFQAAGSSAAYDRHATWVGFLLAGDGGTTQSNGIAYNATLWSGGISTGWNSAGTGVYSEDFNFNVPSFLGPYYTAMISGVAGKTADVINSSWTGTGNQNGDDPYDLTLDSLVNRTGKVVVVAAGNSGGADTIQTPAAGMNEIVVGALSADTDSPPYQTVAGFSSTGPSDFFLPSTSDGQNGTFLSEVRAGIDITAPGSNLTLFDYGGPTGGNNPAFGGSSSNSTSTYDPQMSGTSFSAPTVAAGAALVVDAGKHLFSSDASAIDGRVIRAVLMNSADKPAGWDNGQTTNGNGAVITTQALDDTYGAGILDLAQAYKQYTAGTTDIPAASPSGVAVQPIGWAYNTITHNPAATTTFNYDITGTLQGGSNFDVTLTWFADDTTNADGSNPLYGSFDRLVLKVYQDVNGIPTTVVATSSSLYTSTQLLDFTLPADGIYSIQVSEKNYAYNFDGATTTPYALAWSATEVPEPTAIGLLLLTAFPLLARRRSRRQV